jgi:murein DD-endopeptidase MepM/ murein hydrolase activator NlpD
VVRLAILTAIVIVGAAWTAPAAASTVDVAAGPVGWWEAEDNGAVAAQAGAPHHGDARSLPLVQPVVGMAATPTGRGYWLVASDGGIFTYGDATFHGSTGGIALWQPIVGMAATPTGRGYRLFAADGGVFTFGDAAFAGSDVAEARRPPVVDGGPLAGGYWMARSDGGVATFSATARTPVVAPVCRVEATVAADRSAAGGWVFAADPLAVPTPPAGPGASGIDSEATDALLDHAQACQVADPAVGAALADPLPGAGRSSVFGQRLHPIWGVTQLHSGQDLAAPGGTAILAAAAGTVVGVRQQVAYGNAVVIDHGGRTATVYAHLGRVDVAVGASVAAGGVIGTVGSTGFATGPHLHYEVRIEGEAVDPTPYL